MPEAFQIAKTDEDQRLVFGYANVAFGKDGSQIEDLQGDLIDSGDLELAAYDFVLNFGETGEMHKGEAVGKLVESFVITPEKLAALGLVAKADGQLPHAAWWVGFQVSPESFAKVKDGTFKMFSIQGDGERHPLDIEKDWSTWVKPGGGGRGGDVAPKEVRGALEAIKAEGGRVDAKEALRLGSSLKSAGYKNDGVTTTKDTKSIVYVNSQGAKGAHRVLITKRKFTMGRQMNEVGATIKSQRWKGSQTEGNWEDE